MCVFACVCVGFVCVYGFVNIVFVLLFLVIRDFGFLGVFIWVMVCYFVFRLLGIVRSDVVVVLGVVICR